MGETLEEFEETCKEQYDNVMLSLLEKYLNKDEFQPAFISAISSCWVRKMRNLKSSFEKLHDVMTDIHNDMLENHKEVEKNIQEMIKDEHNITPGDIEYPEYQKTYWEAVKEQTKKVLCCYIKNNIIEQLSEGRVSLEDGEKYENDFDTVFMVIISIDGVELSDKGKMIENNINIANAKLDNLLYKLNHRYKQISHKPVPSSKKAPLRKIQYFISYSVFLGEDYVYIGQGEGNDKNKVINFKFEPWLEGIKRRGYKIETKLIHLEKDMLVYDLYLCWRENETLDDPYNIDNDIIAKTILQPMDDWTMRFIDFKNIWTKVLNNTKYEKYDRKTYAWGRKEIIKKGENKTHLELLNSINMEWDVEKYDQMFLEWNSLENGWDGKISKKWTNKYNSFKEVWEKVCEDSSYIINNYNVDLSLWGKSQMDAELSVIQRKLLNDIAMKWNIDEYEYIYSWWRYYFEICKKLSKEKDYEYLKTFSSYEISNIQDWYNSNSSRELDGCKKEAFDEIQALGASELFQKGIKNIYNELYGIKEGKKKEDPFAKDIVSEWVMYKKYDAYKDSFIVAKEDADYFEVSIAIKSLFSEKEFVEYINKNKKNLVMRARMDIEATQSRNKCEFGYKVKEPPYLEDYDPALKEKYKLNKLVYGLSSRIVTALFFKNE